MRVAAGGAGVALAALVGAALVAISDVELAGSGSRDGLLRLSWRTASRRVEECRAPTATELESLPAHMRPDRICDGRLLPFDLQVRLDGELVIDRELHPAGARGDRPVYVFDQLEVATGPHTLEVQFVPAVAGGDELAALRLATTFSASPRRVVLVTRSGDGGELVLLDASPSARE